MAKLQMRDYNGVRMVTIDYGNRRIVVSGCPDNVKAVISETLQDGTRTEISLSGTIEEVIPQLKVFNSQTRIG